MLYLMKAGVGRLLIGRFFDSRCLLRSPICVDWQSGGALRRGLWKLHFRNPHIPVDTDRIRRVLFPFALKRVGL